MKLTPTKRDKKKYKPATLFSQVTSHTDHAVPGQQNAEKVTVSYSSNMKFDSKAAPVCTANIAQTTADQAKAMCPPDSLIGTGEAHANLGHGDDEVNDTQVNVFNGPGPNHVRLHAFTPEFGAGQTQVVEADLVAKSPSGKPYGPALVVNDAPDLLGDSFMLTLFGATISKSTKTVLARCKDKSDESENKTTWDDGTVDVATVTSKCKQKNA